MAELRNHEMGPAGDCICPKCETRLPHQEGLRSMWSGALVEGMVEMREARKR